jgi:tetratricopeptide (TPR) repeat protein
MAQTEVVISPHEQFRFAETYFEKKAYYRAIGEYERFIYFFPEEPRVKLARYKIGMSYFEGKKFKDAIASFQELIEEYGHTELAPKAHFKISESYSRLKKFHEAFSVLDDLRKTSREQGVQEEALYRQGWICLEMGQWERAQALFDEVGPAKRGEYRIEALTEEMKKGASLETKDPAVAGWLAVLPGAGHVYCERYKDALVAFLLNGAAIFAAVEAFDNGNEALGGLLTFFEAGLYSGNIYSAVNSAHKYNRKQKNRFLQYLKDHARVELSAGPADRGGCAMALGCRISF